MKSQKINEFERFENEQFKMEGFEFKLKIYLETNRGFLEKKGQFFTDEDWEKRLKLYDEAVHEYRNHPVFCVIKKSNRMKSSKNGSELSLKNLPHKS